MEPTEHPDNDPDAPVRTLYRDTAAGQLGGVCSGIARYSGTDPTVIRVLFIVLAVMGPGLLLYPLLWIFVPEAPRPAFGQQPSSPGGAPGLA